MSQEAMRQMHQLLNDSETEGLERGVGMAIAWYANPQSGLAWPQNKALMADWGFAERTIQTALRRLEDLGLLIRQPSLESRSRRRVYLVGSGQLELLADTESRAQRVGAETGAESVAPSILRPHHCAAPAALTRAREGNQRTVNHNSPLVAPPLSETPLAVVPELQQSDGPTPRFPVVERAAPARRRRRRRRPDELGSVASEPCPLQRLGNGSEEKDTSSLLEIWAELDAQLTKQVGSYWEVWGHTAHPHRIDGETLLVGIDPSAAQWVSERLGPWLAQIRPVRFVGCEASA